MGTSTAANIFLGGTVTPAAQPGARQLHRHHHPDGDHPVTRSLVALLLAALPAPLLAQGVLVAPHAIIIDHRTRSGSLSLYNPGTEPSEVTLSTFYGYPVTDSTGNSSSARWSTPDSSAPSAAGWIEAFPKRMVLAPKERQTVRPPRPSAGEPGRTASTGRGWWSRPRVGPCR